MSPCAPRSAPGEVGAVQLEQVKTTGRRGSRCAANAAPERRPGRDRAPLFLGSIMGRVKHTMSLTRLDADPTLLPHQHMCPYCLSRSSNNSSTSPVLALLFGEQGWLFTNFRSSWSLLLRCRRLSSSVKNCSTSSSARSWLGFTEPVKLLDRVGIPLGWGASQALWRTLFVSPRC